MISYLLGVATGWLVFKQPEMAKNLVAQVKTKLGL